MKKHFLLLAILILISASAAFAQSIEQQVAKIRQITVETNKRIDAGLKDKTSGLHHATWTLGGARDGQQWGEDVRLVDTAVEYYFDCPPERLEQCWAEDSKTSLRKAVTSYQGLEGLRYKSEYFFAGDTGELVFSFSTELEANGKTTERQFYFNKGKLIRLTQAGKNTDANFSIKDYQRTEDEASVAKHLSRIFTRIIFE